MITKRNDYPSFRPLYSTLMHDVQHNSKLVHTETWQGLEISNKPEMATHELEDIFFRIGPLMTTDLNHYRQQINPNLPWADDHFERERVSGEPINPGETWKTWPWGLSADKFRTENGQFNHSYAERYWPKHAGITPGGLTRNEEGQRLTAMASPHSGIRYQYGDLNSVVDLLLRNPLTRNAYLPIWFPEDTGIVHGGRAPCTLGYLFRLRDSRLSVTYYIRSCDFRRHFQDDVYLTIRLLLWVLEQCRDADRRWYNVLPGMFSMHIGSLHVFKNDYREMFGANVEVSQGGHGS